MKQVCIKCNQELPLDMFSKDKQKKTGYRKDCRSCNAKIQKKLRDLNIEERRKVSKTYRAKNKDKINSRKKLYRKLNPEAHKIISRRTYRKNLEKIKIRSKMMYQKNKKEIHLKMKIKYHTDIQYRLALNLRRRMHKLIKRSDRNGSAVRDLGCSLNQFKLYIESKFSEGMSWDNYGKWHLDHIYPISRVDLTNRDEFLKIAHYTNYQPLWAEDNLKKSNKLPEEFAKLNIIEES